MSESLRSFSALPVWRLSSSAISELGLPDGHHERVVPRRDLTDGADRLTTDHRRVVGAVLGGCLALEMPHRACEEAQVVGAERDVRVLAELQRAAGLEALQLGDL